MMNSKIIQIPIFNHTLQVVFGTRKEVRKMMIEYNISNEDAKEYAPRLCPKDAMGCFCYFEKYDEYYLWLPQVPQSVGNYASLVHEIEHFVFLFLGKRGFSHVDESDEMYAYLMGFIFAEIDCFINRVHDKKKLYVSVPISGRDIEEVKEEVEVVRAKFLEEYDVVTPFDIEDWHLGESWDWYMARDLEMLRHCDAVVFCKGWQESKGCSLEHEFAVFNKIEILEICGGSC